MDEVSRICNHQQSPILSLEQRKYLQSIFSFTESPVWDFVKNGFGSMLPELFIDDV